MKRIIFILFTAILSLSALAQPTGGGAYDGGPQQNAKTSSEHLYQTKYTGVGISRARGNLRDVYDGTWGLTANMGRIYYIKSFESFLPEGLALGFDVNFLDVRMMLLQQNDNTGLMMSMGVRVGLAVGYSLGKSTSVDLYWDLLPNFSYIYDPYTEDMVYSIFKGFPSALGIRLRHENFNVNIEWEGGHQEYTGDDLSMYSWSVPQQSFNLRVGKCF